MFTGAALIVAMIVDIVFIYYIFSSACIAIRDKENFISLVKEKYSNSFELFKSNLKLVLSLFIIAVILFLNGYLIIVNSGANAQIGSFLEANSFTAKYEATVEIVDRGNFPYYNTFIKNIDGATVEAIVEKNITESNTYYTQTFYGEDIEHTNSDSEYYIPLIKYDDYIVVFEIDDLAEVDVKGPTELEPSHIYKNGTEYKSDYINYYPPTFKITLSDKLIEKLSGNQYKSIIQHSIIYIVFLCLCIIYFTWFFGKKGDEDIQDLERNIKNINKSNRIYRHKAIKNDKLINENEERLNRLHKLLDSLYETKSLENGMTIEQYKKDLKRKSKKSSIIAFIISTIISVVLIILPLYYIVSNDTANVISAKASNETTQTVTTSTTRRTTTTTAKTQATTASIKTTTASTQNFDYDDIKCVGKVINKV